MPCNHLILRCPFSSCPQSLPASGSFLIKSALHIMWSRYWSFSISSSNECSELISLRIDWFDLFAVQGILKTLLQHHSLKASVLWCSVFFMVQHSQLYMTTGKTRALIIWTFVSKEMSLIFNMLSRFVTAILPRGKSLNFVSVDTICIDFGAQENEI